MTLGVKEHEKLVKKFVQVKKVNPGRCDQDVYENGKPLCMLAGPRMWTIESWVKEVAKRAKAKVDWNFSGGRAGVSYLGDDATYQRILQACRETQPAFEQAAIILVEEAQKAEKSAGSWAYPVQWLQDVPW